MKIDKEQVNAGTKTDSRHFEHSPNVVDLFDPKTGDSFLKENKDSNICDLNSIGTESEIEDAALGSVDHSSKKMNPSKTDSVFYVDKSITDHGLPKLVVYCKESTYRVVKDICVDEGVHSKEKFLFDSCGCEKRVCTLPSLGNDTETQMVKESVNVQVPTSNAWKSSSEGKEEDHAAIPDKFSSNNKQLRDSSSSEFNSKHLVPTGELEGHRTDKTAKLDKEIAGLDSSSLHTNDVQEQSLQGLDHKSKEDHVMTPSPSPDNASTASTVSGNCIEEPKSPGQRINFNSERLESWNISMQEDADGGRTVMNKLQPNSLGESSFSAAISGRIPYSGSLSVRSDSSTTSTRSFAFPILQPEWNSSPVRMAKADRRQKLKSWKQCLLCCKF